MKTIKEYLKTCNRAEIAQIFIFNYILNSEINLYMLKAKTIAEILEEYTKKVNILIDKILSTVSKKEEPYILMVVHNSSPEGLDYILVKQSEVLANEQIYSYSYEFSEFDEVAGFCVADNYLTQYYINNLIADYLYHVSFTGFNHEQLQVSLDRIESSLKECEEHRNDPEYFVEHEEMFKQFEERYGIETEKQDPIQSAAQTEFIGHKIEYDKKCRQIEIDKLRRELCKETQQK